MPQIVMVIALATISFVATNLLAYESTKHVRSGSMKAALAQSALLWISCILLLRVGPLAGNIQLAILLGALVSLAAFDFHSGYVPNAALVPLAALCMLHFLLGNHRFEGVFGSMLLAGAGIALYIVGGGASFGLGDVKLLGIVGAILGAGRALPLLGAAFVIGGAIALICLASGRYTRRDALPFVPMLGLAFLWQVVVHAF